MDNTYRIPLESTRKQEEEAEALMRQMEEKEMEIRRLQDKVKAMEIPKSPKKWNDKQWKAIRSKKKQASKSRARNR